MAKHQETLAEAAPAAVPATSEPTKDGAESPVVVTDPIKLDEGAEALLAVEPVVVIEDAPAEIDPVEYRAAENENRKRDFVEKVLEARKPNPEPTTLAGPVPPRVMEQTLAEQNAGRACVAKHEEHYARHPMPRADEAKTNTAVFRPADYVPNQKKGQGYTQARTLA